MVFKKYQICKCVEVCHFIDSDQVTWSWKKDDEQKFLAIGIVKITHNQRVHISKIQKSDEVTQFNLYVYNIRKDDEGVYYCSVNSNPMIEQVNTLKTFYNLHLVSG